MKCESQYSFGHYFKRNNMYMSYDTLSYDAVSYDEVVP